MNKTISHRREEESIEAKTRWFRSLSLPERMELLCSFTDLALEINPKLPELKDTQQIDRLYKGNDLRYCLPKNLWNFYYIMEWAVDDWTSFFRYHKGDLEKG